MPRFSDMEKLVVLVDWRLFRIDRAGGCPV
jgi:hypothetical protein